MRLARHFVVFVLVGSIGLLAAASCAHAQPKADQPKADQPEQSSKSDETPLSVSELETRARLRELGDRDYPLHDYSRKVSGDEPKCPEIDVVEYSGEVITYNRPIEVNKDFRERLIRFEKLVKEVATEVYGRAPERIVHAGGHTCKTVGGRGKKLSEHAFGHAIDVAGFDFAAAPDGDAETSKPVDKAFSVRVQKHWDASEGLAAKHSRFLHRLAEALKQRGPFSTMLGPAYKGHDRFFHFDFGPQFFFRI